MKIGNNGNLVLGPFDESTPCLTIVLDELPNQTENKSLDSCEIGRHLGKKMKRGGEDQILSSINHIKNLTSLTSSKCNKLNGQVTLLEWTKTAPLKKSSIPNQMVLEKKAGQILDG
ncbi:hypothetical protein TNCV_1623971 [Trichonephila clavipes]|nr:hypothetical protein TNCV_1623971 [Trichonephila clavipes]